MTVSSEPNAGWEELPGVRHTQLQVDVFCPALGGEEDLMDVRIEPARMEK